MSNLGYGNVDQDIYSSMMSERPDFLDALKKGIAESKKRKKAEEDQLKKAKRCLECRGSGWAVPKDSEKEYLTEKCWNCKGSGRYDYANNHPLRHNFESEHLIGIDKRPPILPDILKRNAEADE